MERTRASRIGKAQKLPLALWATRRRQELLELLDRMNPTIEELTAAAMLEAKKRPEALRLMTHPGVGPLTALAFCVDHRDTRAFWLRQTDLQLRGTDSQ